MVFTTMTEKMQSRISVKERFPMNGEVFNMLFAGKFLLTANQDRTFWKKATTYHNRLT